VYLVQVEVELPHFVLHTSDVMLLGASNMGSVVDSIAGGVTGGIGSWIVFCVGSSVNWLHNFILTTYLFGHRRKGSIIVVVTTMAESLCCILEGRY
jgi:hypothetical protein